MNDTSNLTIQQVLKYLEDVHSTTVEDVAEYVNMWGDMDREEVVAEIMKKWAIREWDTCGDAKNKADYEGLGYFLDCYAVLPEGVTREEVREYIEDDECWCGKCEEEDSD